MRPQHTLTCQTTAAPPADAPAYTRPGHPPGTMSNAPKTTSLLLAAQHSSKLSQRCCHRACLRLVDPCRTPTTPAVECTLHTQETHTGATHARVRQTLLLLSHKTGTARGHVPGTQQSPENRPPATCADDRHWLIGWCICRTHACPMPAQSEPDRSLHSVRAARGPVMTAGTGTTQTNQQLGKNGTTKTAAGSR